MTRFIKRPVGIEAIQWNGMNTKIILEFMGQNINLDHYIAGEKFDEYCQYVAKNGLDIKTLEDGDDGRAKHVASVGDYIIKGVHGEFYPCKPDIFEKTYFSEEEYAQL